jgi:hypothetical protein
MHNPFIVYEVKTHHFMEAVLSAPDSFADVQCSELLQSATHEKGDAKENCCHH